MKKYISILVSFLICFNLSARIPDVVRTFDIRSYDPLAYGLKDLTFEIRVSNLLEFVQKRIVTAKIEDIYYKVYWTQSPLKLEIKVMGLPPGFTEIKQELVALVRNRLDYILPKKLAPKIQGYSLKSSKLKSGLLIKGKDKSNRRSINEIKLAFDKIGKLQKLEMSSPAGYQKSELSLSPKSWSHNKWVVDKVTSTTIAGVQTTVIESDLDYANVSGFGFPEKVLIKTTQKLNAPGKNGKEQKRVIENIITFSSFKVNSGKAKEYFSARKR